MTLYTIGHSHIAIERFVDLLRLYLIHVLVDARSQPYSRYAPQFNRDSLKTSLQQVGIAYLYLGDRLDLGDRLGGRPGDARYYFPNGKVDYDRLAEASFYREGLKRLKHEAEGCCLALMCREADYKNCHRYNLITRSLVKDGVEVHHILHSGDLAQTHPEEFARAAHQLELF
jgi:uncharacterized protein (DUF488 family)